MSFRFAFRALLVATTIALAAPASADTLAVGDWVRFSDAPGDNAPGGGGPFLLKGPGVGNEWQTFCLEATEYMNYSDQFYVAGISKAALNGGPGYSAAGGGDPLSLKTQAVYHQYRTGNALGWNGAAVQQAIWFLEEETPGVNNAIVSWANANAATYNFAGYSVWVVNLTTGPNGGTAQDQLMLRPVPEPASVALLGSAVLGLALRRRRARA